VIDELEARGHAVRERDPSDRRRNAVAATAGRHWLRSRMETMEERAARYLPGLEPDERATLRSLLLRVLAHHDSRVPRAIASAEPPPACSSRHWSMRRSEPVQVRPSARRSACSGRGAPRRGMLIPSVRRRTARTERQATSTRPALRKVTATRPRSALTPVNHTWTR
jgi:hypothetical protein